MIKINYLKHVDLYSKCLLVAAEECKDERRYQEHRERLAKLETLSRPAVIARLAREFMEASMKELKDEE